MDRFTETRADKSWEWLEKIKLVLGCSGKKVFGHGNEVKSYILLQSFLLLQKLSTLEIFASVGHYVMTVVSTEFKG